MRSLVTPPALQVRSTSPEWVREQMSTAGIVLPDDAVTAYLTGMAMALIDVRSYEAEEWVNELTVPYLVAHMTPETANAAGKVRARDGGERERARGRSSG